MTSEEDVDYGPLSGLIGTWVGDEGADVAPEPDGIENNAYYEQITFSGIGMVTNAESQVLAAVTYQQIVQRKSTHKVFHHQSGYWMWEKDSGLVIHSFTIPRGVNVLASGSVQAKVDNTAFVFDVSAKLGDEWGIIQSPFMLENAKTTEFRQYLSVQPNKLSYSQTTFLDIYGKNFEHTDHNSLTREA